MGRSIVDGLLYTTFAFVIGVVVLSYANGSLMTGFARGMQRAAAEE